MINCIVSNVRNLSAGSFLVSMIYINSDFYSNGFTMPIGSGNILLNPLYVDLAKEDFHLQLASPCINSGTNLPYVTNDFDGVIRPEGIGYDIGAYEFTPTAAKNNSDGISSNENMDQYFSQLTPNISVFPNPATNAITVITNQFNNIIILYARANCIFYKSNFQ